jgi:flagellar basal-body rod protein FlgB
MRPEDIPVLAMLRQSMGYHSDRQRVIAENVANANTPGYTPQDIAQSEFERALNGAARPSRVTLQTSDAGHRQGTPVSTNTWRAGYAPDSETTINGNSVVIEEQMVRSSDNRVRFETALSLYRKGLDMIRAASRAPGA